MGEVFNGFEESLFSLKVISKVTNTLVIRITHLGSNWGLARALRAELLALRGSEDLDGIPKRFLSFHSRSTSNFLACRASTSATKAALLSSTFSKRARPLKQLLETNRI